jgi:hypothetical protein
LLLLKIKSIPSRPRALKEQPNLDTRKISLHDHVFLQNNPLEIVNASNPCPYCWAEKYTWFCIKFKIKKCQALKNLKKKRDINFVFLGDIVRAVIFTVSKRRKAYRSY